VDRARSSIVELALTSGTTAHLVRSFRSLFGFVVIELYSILVHSFILVWHLSPPCSEFGGRHELQFPTFRYMAASRDDSATRSSPAHRTETSDFYVLASVEYPDDFLYGLMNEALHQGGRNLLALGYSFYDLR